MEEKIINTNKMKVVIYNNYVLKIFKKTYGYKKRYLIEKKALNLLDGVAGVPKILSFSDKDFNITITRISGTNSEHFSNNELKQLKAIMIKTIKLGVARHSLPNRDILIDKNGNVGIVDFERATLKKDSLIIVWYIASLVTKFHVFKFISQHNYKLLTTGESIFVQFGFSIKKVFSYYKLVRNNIRNLYRDILKVVPN